MIHIRFVEPLDNGDYFFVDLHISMTFPLPADMKNTVKSETHHDKS
jgi:hypothetical protein